jgi:hypothetical protein
MAVLSLVLGIKLSTASRGSRNWVFDDQLPALRQHRHDLARDGARGTVAAGPLVFLNDMVSSYAGCRESGFSSAHTVHGLLHLASLETCSHMMMACGPARPPWSLLEG